MNRFISRTLKEIRLKSRFAARKLGFPSWQIHQVRLPEQKLIYIPIPKNACTSVKQALHEIEFGRVFDTDRTVNEPFTDVHDFYKKRDNAFTSIQNLQETTDHTRFAIIRDPVERLISCYRNRVLDLGDLRVDTEILDKMGLPEEPDVNAFVLNLANYQKTSKSIEHHSRSQASYLGGTLRYLDKVYPIEEADELYEWLNNYAPDLERLNRKSGGTAVDVSDLSAKALRHAVWFYRRDYKLLKSYYTPPNS